ncbi:L-asparaginase [Rhodococcus sp. 27YEA15]|uniref:asparaginase n=1 Tax=Rhodococcus sp. 27YEA15 TaxID=3156259 RepID=UPI003C7AEF24
MKTVVVVTTGGTIASTANSRGVKVASVSGADLLAGTRVPDTVALRLVDIASVNSFAMDFGDMDRIHDAIRAALDEPDTCGVVVTHGTDTLEETAMLVDVFHCDPRPVVFTGAQRSADDPDTDGPRNFHDAVLVAASDAARDHGVLISFDGTVHAARGTRKVHTNAPAAFSDPDHGPVGTVDGEVAFRSRRRRRPRRRPAAIGGIRVDTIAFYPGADRIAMDACVAAGAHGLVLEGTGYGNANADIVAAVDEHTASGIPVVLSSRVHAGAVRAVYGGGGGGVDLVDAGAILAGHLRPGQARVLLAASIAAGADRTAVAHAFATPTHSIDLLTANPGK